MAMPLEGIRVANFGWQWAGPAFGQVLADMGAEVFKIESAARPDSSRTAGAMLADRPGHSFLSQNTYRNQRSVTLNLQSKEGPELARALVRLCDVVMENFRPGVMKRYGLDYDSLLVVKPDIIMLSLSAAGQTGPLKEVVTYGSTLASLTGLDSLQGYFRDRPLPFGTTLLDPFNGVFGAYAVLAALEHRAQTGQGQHIDMAQWEATASVLGGAFLEYQLSGEVPGPLGNYDPSMAPHGVYPCAGEDAWVSIAVRTEDEWRAFCDALGNPGWTRDPNFADRYRRVQHHAELDGHVSEWTRTRTNQEVASLLQGQGVAAFPAFSDRELFEDPHMKARGNWVTVQHPLGPVTIYGLSWRLHQTPGAVRRACPLLGQDSGYVLGEVLGIPREEVDRLKEGKVVY